MQGIERKALYEVLDRALLGRRCVQVWLGYADVLFAGFGEEVLPPAIVGPGANELDQPEPLYQLQSRLAHWELHLGEELITSSHDDPDAWEESQAMVGMHVSSWQVIDRALEVTFHSGHVLKIIPYGGAGSEYQWRDAWAVRDKTCWCSILTGDGSAYRIHRTEPCPNDTERERLFGP